MSKHNKLNFGTYAVRNTETGEIDVEATTFKFSNDLQSQIAHETNDLDAIFNAVGKVFDIYPGVNITTDSVIHAVLRELGVGVLDDQPMVKRVRKYLQDNAGEKREDGKLYKAIKGPNGGLCRWSEYVEKTPKPSKKNG